MCIHIIMANGISYQCVNKYVNAEASILLL